MIFLCSNITGRCSMIGLRYIMKQAHQTVRLYSSSNISSGESWILGRRINTEGLVLIFLDAS